MKTSFWNTFSAAPHRLFFFSGAIQLILPLLVWLIELTGRYTDLWSPLNTVIPSTWAHGFVMIYGIFIFFIFGFLMTVFPRWMGYKAIDKALYVAPFIWLNLGLFIFEFSLFFSKSALLSGLGVFLFGWLSGISVLYQTFKHANAQSKYYETILLGSLSFGAIGILAYGWWLYSDNWQFMQHSFKLGIWLYLIPTLFTVSHRMLPFFSSNIIDNYSIFQPKQSLFLFIGGSACHFSLDYLSMQEWLFLIDIPLAILVLVHTIRWRIQHSFKDRLLAVLHMSFFWLFIGLVLFSIQSLLLQFTGEYILNRAPLHAITIGFFASLLIAMASRVTMGHSGRMLILDNSSWYLFIGLQITAVLRVTADMLLENIGLHNNVNLLAALLWLSCMSVWFIKFAPIYLTARIDGREG